MSLRQNFMDNIVPQTEGLEVYGSVMYIYWSHCRQKTPCRVFFHFGLEPVINSTSCHSKASHNGIL